jgi:hypothetical protein
MMSPPLRQKWPCPFCHKNTVDDPGGILTDFWKCQNAGDKDKKIPACLKLWRKAPLPVPIDPVAEGKKKERDIARCGSGLPRAYHEYVYLILLGLILDAQAGKAGILHPEGFRLIHGDDLMALIIHKVDNMRCTAHAWNRAKRAGLIDYFVVGHSKQNNGSHHGFWKVL